MEAAPYCSRSCRLKRCAGPMPWKPVSAAAPVAHQHVDVAALGNVVTVQGFQAADDHQPAAGHGGAGVAGQPHGIQVAIGEDAVARGAQKAGQTVLHRQCGGLIEEGRVAFRVEGQRVGRRRQVAVGPGWLRRPKGRGIKGGSRSQGSGHRVISCKQGRHGLPIEITRSAAHRLDNRQLPGRMFRSCLTPLQVSSPPLGEGCRPSHAAAVQARRGWKPGCRPRFQTAGQCRQNAIRNVALKKRGWP